MFLFVVPIAASAQDAGMEQFWQREMVDLQRALASPSIASRVHNIWMQLARYSGRAFPVLPAQQFTLGQALPNGIVLLDLSIAGKPDVEVTAFTMAHEFAHQVMGHPQLAVTDVGRWMAAVGGTRQEDDADRYAGRFLRSAGYRLEPVVSFLCSLPTSGPGDSHSDGPTRATLVARTYGRTAVDCAAAEDEDDDEADTHDVAVSIWSRYEGNPATMRVLVDGDEVGTLGNLRGAETLDIGPLRSGRHTFSIEDIVVYGPYGPVAQGLACSTTFSVSGERRFRLWAQLTPLGELVCRFR